MFEIKFDTGNAAFDEYDTYEIRRILKEVANSLEWKNSGSVIDINGNKIGSWKYVRESN